MKHVSTIYIAACIVLLSACGTSSVTLTPPSPTIMPTITHSTPPEHTATLEPIGFLLSESGPYHVGVKYNIAYEDPSRKGRKVIITIWYPAIQPQDSTSSDPVADAMPDLTNAPYPLILSSGKVGSFFASHLVSYGFVHVGIRGQDSQDNWGQWLTDYPLDIVYALNQIATNPPEELAAVIDANHAGAMGYSFDGYTSLALSGARIDPEFYLAQCANAAAMDLAPPTGWIDYNCNMTGGWNAFVANAGPLITTSSDGLWQPITDKRIRAVMPMAPEGAWLFGESGLSAADRPTLIIGATNDGINIYNLEAAYIFEHLGTPNRTMISFVDQGHMMIYDADQFARMKHFAVAFFGYHLQGYDDYSKYFSEEFVAQYDDLAWGVYKK